MSNEIKYPTEEDILKEANERQLEGAEPYSFAGGARWAISQIKKELLNIEFNNSFLETVVKNEKLALEINRMIHNECKDVPHDIGARIMELIEKEYDFKFE